MDEARTHAYVALGSNLGDRESNLVRAFDALSALPGTALIARSRVIETPPVGPPGQGPYLNAAAALRTSLSARALLEGLQAIEERAGRKRSRETRWGPREIDLDLLLMGDQIIAESGLIVPHPRMHERRFVLAPLAEIAPDVVHPVLGASVQTLLERLDAPQ